MSPLNRLEKAAARQLAKAEGINYTAARRLVRMARQVGQDRASEPLPPQPLFDLRSERQDMDSFKFTDYADRILTGREAGVPKLDWAPGVLTHGAIARDTFTGAGEPHLLVAGQPGSGKSVLLRSLILQLLHNNGPSEVRLWAVDPFDGLQCFRNSDLVERMPRPATPGRGGSYLDEAADLMEDAVREMGRRIALFASHAEAPSDLSAARKVAATESSATGAPLDGHPLHLPYLVVIDETNGMFSEDLDSLDEAAQQRLRAAAERLGRGGRTAGIHLVASALEALPGQLPAAIAHNARRIGFRCRTAAESIALTGEAGLEVVRAPGVGRLAASNGENRTFRAFDLTHPLDGGPGGDDDVTRLLRAIPRNDRAPEAPEPVS